MSEAADPNDAEGGPTALERHLTEDCRDALSALEEVRPQSELIAVEGDWAYISIGTVHPAHVNPVFDQDEAHAVIRIPTSFPTGADPYGIVTYPYVTKHDGEDVHREHRNHDNGEPAREAFDVDEVGFWSYRWQNISATDPVDLQKALEIVRSRFEKED